MVDISTSPFDCRSACFNNSFFNFFALAQAIRAFKSLILAGLLGIDIFDCVYDRYMYQHCLLEKSKFSIGRPPDRLKL
jgi:hypothetical protein